MRYLSKEGNLFLPWWGFPALTESCCTSGVLRTSYNVEVFGGVNSFVCVRTRGESNRSDIERSKHFYMYCNKILGSITIMVIFIIHSLFMDILCHTVC